MKIVCAPSGFEFERFDSDLQIVLFGRAETSKQGSSGEAVLREVLRQKLVPSDRAWDLLSIALSVVSADLAGHRKKSPDGWTRELELIIAVQDPSFWNKHSEQVESLLCFLTTDRWSVSFIDGGFSPNPDYQDNPPTQDCVALLSGGLDSLIGNIDLVEDGRTPFAVTQTVRGDGHKQTTFAEILGGGLRQFKANHNATVPDPETPSSQRSRSIIFLAYGVLVASTLEKYKNGDRVELYVCENGFISINPPLTSGRVGSLSTRTTHPVVFSILQDLLDDAKLNVEIKNPYRLKTKGEMLVACRNQGLLKQLASKTTSCGRYLVFGHKHCGRCVPCLVRRASFLTWGVEDETHYVHTKLGIRNEENAGYDDVRSALIANIESKEIGVHKWLGSALSSERIKDKSDVKNMIERGLNEIGNLLNHYGVK